MIDLRAAPEVEYDDSGDGSMILTWMAERGIEMFSVIIRDGSVIGGITPNGGAGKFWKAPLPDGFVKIDCGALHQATESNTKTE